MKNLIKILNIILIHAFKQKKIVLIVLLALISFYALTRFINFNSSDSAYSKSNTIDIKKDKAVAIYTTALEEVTDTIDILGQITYYEKVSISSKVQGRLQKIYIKEGKKVRKQELLTEIERLPLEIQLKQQLSLSNQLQLQYFLLTL